MDLSLTGFHSIFDLGLFLASTSPADPTDVAANSKDSPDQLRGGDESREIDLGQLVKTEGALALAAEQGIGDQWSIEAEPLRP